MVDRITRLDRRIGLAVVVLVALGVMGLVSWLVTSRSDEGGDGPVAGGPQVSPAAVGETAEWLLPPSGDGVGPDGQLAPPAALVAQAVAATIEAMPTPTPLPTPDIASTLQAEMFRNRELAPPVVVLNPLDRQVDRNPYLTPSELRYFRELGPRLWAYTRVWLHLQRVLSVDVAEWDPDLLEHDLGSAQAALETAPDAPPLSSGHPDDVVDPLVRAYADSIEEGIVGVRQAVARLSDAERVLVGEVGHSERDLLLRISREVEDFLSKFDAAMSAYGCSVCGELFRREKE